MVVTYMTWTWTWLSLPSAIDAKLTLCSSIFLAVTTPEKHCRMYWQWIHRCILTTVCSGGQVKDSSKSGRWVLSLTGHAPVNRHSKHQHWFYERIRIATVTKIYCTWDYSELRTLTVLQFSAPFIVLRPTQVSPAWVVSHWPFEQ